MSEDFNFTSDFRFDLPRDVVDLDRFVRLSQRRAGPAARLSVVVNNDGPHAAVAEISRAIGGPRRRWPWRILALVVAGLVGALCEWRLARR